MDIGKFITELIEQVEEIEGNHQISVKLEEKRNNLTTQQALIEEMKSLGSARNSHNLCTLTERYNQYKLNYFDLQEIHHMIQQTVNDYSTLCSTYLEIISNENFLQENYVELLPITGNENMKKDVDDNDTAPKISLITTMENDLFRFRKIYDDTQWLELWHEIEQLVKELERTIYQMLITTKDNFTLIQQYQRFMQYQPKRHQYWMILNYYKKLFEKFPNENIDETKTLLQQIEIETPRKVDDKATNSYKTYTKQLIEIDNDLKERHRQISISTINHSDKIQRNVSKMKLNFRIK